MPAWIAAGAAVVGDVMSQQGQQATNAQSAAEAQQNRDFQAAQQQQVETWETDMSNTAMQRRVTDLNTAGLNPLLAVSQGGASQPSVSPASGSMPSLANPSSAFGNLGQQVSSAMQTSAAIDLTNAQADKAKADAALTRWQTGNTPKSDTTVDDDGNITVTGHTNNLGDAQLAQIQAQTGATTSQAQQIQANIKQINSQTDLTTLQAQLESQNLDVLLKTKAALVQQETASGAAAKNLQHVEQGKLGPALAIINAILKPMTSAAGVAKLP